jgi:FemAB-related protein (PEP-CTERM system-associated)
MDTVIEPAQNVAESHAAWETAADSVHVVSDVPATEWDEYVGSSPDAVAYHQHCWRGVFERAFGHETIYLAARRGQRLAGVLPIVSFRSPLFGRFGVSLPFVNYGGVLADGDREAAALERAALALARERRWRHVELRHVTERYPHWPAKRHKVAMSLSLPPVEDTLWSGLDRKVRNQVRKAEKSGCTPATGGVELLPEFYGVFARNMRDLGTPVYGRSFFEEVLRTFERDTQVFVVRLGGEPIAAAITVGWRDRVEVPWASALRAHNDKSPNMLLYWMMLHHAIARGAQRFDFGRSTPGEGTFHFKRQWGAEAMPVVWEYVGLSGTLPDLSPKNAKFRGAIAAWQRLPVPIASAIGPLIVRNIP